MLPKKAKRGGYAYVIVFSNGTVKVGQTADPQGRISSHAYHAKAFDAEIADQWLSPLHMRPDLSEVALIASMRRLSGATRASEWFRGVSFTDAVGAAEALNIEAMKPEREPTTRSMLSLDGKCVGNGEDIAHRLWLILWSLVRRPDGSSKGRPGQTWYGNKRLAQMACSQQRTVTRGLTRLRKSGFVTTRWGRPWGSTSPVRVITLTPTGCDPSDILKLTPSYTLPAHEDMAALHKLIPGTRPGPTFTLAVALLACASMEWESGWVRPTGDVLLHIPMIQLREMTGVCLKGGAFYPRMRKLEAIGLIKRVDERWMDGLIVPPISEVIA